MSDVKKSDWDPEQHFQLRMSVGMPEGFVPDDARRISTQRFEDKDRLATTVGGSREVIAHIIRRTAEELIRAIYEQMDRQENTHG